MIRKLRLKFIVINMGFVTVMLCVIFALVLYFTRANLEAESISMMQNIANRPFQLGMPIEYSEDVRLPYFAIRIGIHGELMATGGGYYDLSDYEFLYDLINVTYMSHKTFGVIKEYNLRYYRVDTPLDRCIVFADISSEQTTLDNLVKSSFVIGGFSFILFLCISILLSKWAVKPVDLAWKQQRQFVADASHELKTPLTVIMTNTELALSPEYDEANRQKFLSGILTMTRQMKRLIEQMLELARADNSDSRKIFKKVDFSRLVTDSILTFEPVFFEKGLTLTAHVENDIKVKGDEDQLCQILDILLDNARKYSKEAGTTWVRLNRSKKGRCILMVANEGETISPQDAKNIFKRFYRIDKARSRTGSFGLGLSIADSIVKQHKGKIWVESGDGVNSFYVELTCV